MFVLYGKCRAHLQVLEVLLGAFRVPQNKLHRVLENSQVSLLPLGYEMQEVLVKHFHITVNDNAIFFGVKPLLHEIKSDCILGFCPKIFICRQISY
jgi:hypothetical protein